MKSLREAAQKITGSAQPVSMSSLAQKLNLSRPVSLKAICNDADFFGNYIFRLDSFHIEILRSGTLLGKTSKDTDHVGFTLKVGNNQTQTVTKHMGDLRTGTYNVGLEIGPITITDPNTLVTFNYQIVNAGHRDQKEIENGLKSAGVGLINAGGDILAASLAGGIWGIIIGGGVALASLGFGELLSLFFANCDGLVAADQVAVTGSTLKNWVSSSGSYSPGQRYYPGLESNQGCGDNSKYYVTWSVRKV